MLYANLIGRIAFFTGENIAHIEFYLQGLLPKILAIYTINTVHVHCSTLSHYITCKLGMEYFFVFHQTVLSWINGLGT